MRKGEAYRQGDVLLVRAAQLPRNIRKLARRDGRLVLADGEATGHAHAIEEPGVQLYERRLTHPIEARLTREGRLPALFLVVGDEGATVLHEEHEPIAIPPGEYEIRRQREYDPLARLRARIVAD